MRVRNGKRGRLPHPDASLISILGWRREAYGQVQGQQEGQKQRARGEKPAAVAAKDGPFDERSVCANAWGRCGCGVPPVFMRIAPCNRKNKQKPGTPEDVSAGVSIGRRSGRFNRSLKFLAGYVYCRAVRFSLSNPGKRAEFVHNCPFFRLSATLSQSVHPWPFSFAVHMRFIPAPKSWVQIK